MIAHGSVMRGPGFTTMQVRELRFLDEFAVLCAPGLLPGASRPETRATITPLQMHSLPTRSALHMYGQRLTHTG